MGVRELGNGLGNPLGTTRVRRLESTEASKKKPLLFQDPTSNTYSKVNNLAGAELSDGSVFCFGYSSVNTRPELIRATLGSYGGFDFLTGSVTMPNATGNSDPVAVNLTDSLAFVALKGASSDTEGWKVNTENPASLSPGGRGLLTGGGGAFAAFRYSDTHAVLFTKTSSLLVADCSGPTPVITLAGSTGMPTNGTMPAAVQLAVDKYIVVNSTSNFWSFARIVRFQEGAVVSGQSLTLKQGVTFHSAHAAARYDDSHALISVDAYGSTPVLYLVKADGDELAVLSQITVPEGVLAIARLSYSDYVVISSSGPSCFSSHVRVEGGVISLVGTKLVGAGIAGKKTAQQILSGGGSSFYAKVSKRAIFPAVFASEDGVYGTVLSFGVGFEEWL